MNRIAFAIALATALMWPAGELVAQEQFLGTWESTTTTGRGSFTQSFVFTMEEEVLKGTVTTTGGRGGGAPTELTNIAVEEGTLTFQVTRTFRDNSFTQTYTVTVEETEMKGTVSGGRGGRGGGEPREFTATKKVG